MFTNTYLPHVGGVARSVSFFAQDLRNAGHRVLIIAPKYPGSEAHDESEPDIFRAPALQKFNGSDFSLRIPSPFLVDEQVDAFKPDIIHSHHPYLLGDAALRAAWRRKLPLVFTHHTLYEEYTHYIARNPENMKRFAAFLSTNYANLCDQVIAPSQSIRDLIQERGVETPVAVIPTGVDTSFFARGDGEAFRKAHQTPENAFVIGHLGRLAPEKNLDYLANALALALQKNSDAFCLMVGKGPSEKEIERIFSKHGVEDRLVMGGEKSGKDLVNAYHAMNLFVFASKTETQGMVLTEAMAAGVPVIALDAPGAREVVEDDENGCLLESEAPEDRLAHILVEAIQADEKRAVWARGAGETAKRFSREKCARKLSRLYSETIQRQGRHSQSESLNLDLWDRFLLACRAEWELAAEKSESVMQTMDENEEIAGLDASA